MVGIDVPPLIAAQAIAQFINGSAITVLHLNGLGLSTQDIFVIAQALQFSSIQELDLSSNNMKAESIAALASGLRLLRDTSINLKR
jgi:hypothetical protein